MNKGLLRIGVLCIILLLVVSFLYLLVMPKQLPENPQTNETENTEANEETQVEETEDQQQEETETTPTEEEVEVQQSLDLSVGNSFSDEIFNVTVFSQEKVSSYEYFSETEQRDITENAGSGKTFLVIEIRVHNRDKNEQTFSISEFELSDSEDETYNPRIYRGEDTIDTTTQLNKNERIRGKILFRIPSDSQNLKLYFDFPFIFDKTEEPYWNI